METKHTQAPWIVGAKNTPAGGFETTQILSDNSEVIATVETAFTEGEANARRIVACVNACEGISTEALEQGVVQELLAACIASDSATTQGALDKAVDMIRDAKAKGESVEELGS